MKGKARRIKPLQGHEQRAANAFLRSVVFTYDSRWMLEREGDARKACEPRFKRPFTSTYMSPERRAAYIGMFTKETVYKLQARWFIECWVWFRDDDGKVYAEQGQMISDFGKINDAMPAFEKNARRVERRRKPQTLSALRMARRSLQRSATF